MTAISSDASAFLWDACYAAEKIVRFTSGLTLDDYLAGDMVRAAVERQFEIIGEALGGLRRAYPELAAEIPNLPQIVAFRNVLMHGYATVNNRLVWAFAENELPGLRATLSWMLANDDSQPK